MAIHKDHTRDCVLHPPCYKVRNGKLNLPLSRQFERRPRERGDIGEAPVLLPRGRKPDSTEACKRSFTKLMEPLWSDLCSFLHKFGEVLQIACELGDFYCHSAPISGGCRRRMPRFHLEGAIS